MPDSVPDPTRATAADELPIEDLTVLLMEASAACNGNLNVLALRSAIKDMPDAVLDHAGLQWARRSFDDDAPTSEQVAKWQSGNGPVQPPPRLVIPPKDGPK